VTLPRGGREVPVAAPARPIKITAALAKIAANLRELSPKAARKATTLEELPGGGEEQDEW
jgi:hypothetical protein